jgi:serine/threonine protein kinase
VYKNVLIQQCPSDGERDVWWVKLIDFGFSRELESTLTGSATVCGTMAYMAPEILKRFRGLEQRHSPMAVDYPAADMWAVGVMAFRILAGMDPFPNLPDVLKYCNHSEFFPFLRCVIVG